MKKTLTTIGSVLMITTLMSAVTVAADDSGANVKKLEAMGAARARLQQAMQAVSQSCTDSASSYTVKIAENAINYEKTCKWLDNVIQMEQAKPEAERNAERLRAMNSDRQNIGELWSKYTSINKIAIDAKLAAVNQLYVSGLQPVCASLSAMDIGWTMLNLDMDPMKTMYELLGNSAMQIKSQQQAVLAEMDVQVMIWRDALANAKGRYSAGPTQAK